MDDDSISLWWDTEGGDEEMYNCSSWGTNWWQWNTGDPWDNSYAADGSWGDIHDHWSWDAER